MDICALLMKAARIMDIRRTAFFARGTPATRARPAEGVVLKRQPGQGAVNVFVIDVDALYQELKSCGARVLNEPKDGMRDFDINDLDGNQLCFGMESKST
jgi:hypothetical protein